MFEETLYQSCADGKPFVDVLRDQGIMPGIKVDGGLEASHRGRGGGRGGAGGVWGLCIIAASAVITDSGSMVAWRQVACLTAVACGKAWICTGAK